MRKVLLALIVLTMCLSMLTSCGALIENATDAIVAGVIDSVQAEYEEKGYTVQRMDEEALEEATNEIKELLGSEFKGELTHFLFCARFNEQANSIESVYVYALSELSDGNLLENYFRKEYARIDEEGMTIDINNAGFIVTVESTYQ